MKKNRTLSELTFAEKMKVLNKGSRILKKKLKKVHKSLDESMLHWDPCTKGAK
jgi:hypothetical protein